MDVRIVGEVTELIDIGSGIRQGDSLSPTLFNLTMNEIIKIVNKGRGYRMRNNELKILCYADDAAAQDEDSLQTLVHKCNIRVKAFNMTISTQKMRIKYLGNTLSSYGDEEREVSDQVQKANKTGRMP